MKEKINKSLNNQLNPFHIKNTAKLFNCFLKKLKQMRIKNLKLNKMLNFYLKTTLTEISNIMHLIIFNYRLNLPKKEKKN